MLKKTLLISLLSLMSLSATKIKMSFAHDGHKHSATVNVDADNIFSYCEHEFVFAGHYAKDAQESVVTLKVFTQDSQGNLTLFAQRMLHIPFGNRANVSMSHKHGLQGHVEELMLEVEVVE